MPEFCTCDFDPSFTGGRCDTCGKLNPDFPFVCDLCWWGFATQDELDQHVAMEEAVEWTIDQLDDAEIDA